MSVFNTQSTNPHFFKNFVPPVVPTRLRHRILSLGHSLFRPLLRFLIKKNISDIEIVGVEKIKKNQPYLVLMNHTTALDPLVLTSVIPPYLHFLITEPFMYQRFFSKLISHVGQVTKRKLDPDTRSIRSLKQWSDLGGSVALFPEGQFSWDGRPLPLQPGLKELVRYLGIPIVTVRLSNGDRLWPAWAKKPRKTKLRIEFDEPILLKADIDVEKYISEKLFVDPNNCIRFPVTGENLADGLPGFLRYCFQCESDSTLVSDQNWLLCRQCGGQWSVNTENSLLQGTQTFSIEFVWKKIKEDLNRKWNHSGLQLTSVDQVSVFDISRSQWKFMNSGILKIDHNGLSINEWTIKKQEILAHILDWGNLILIRTPRQRLALRFDSDSRAVWTHAIEFLLMKDRELNS